MDYYAIKDKATGFYFRGKGVNRWGTHLNQASIYRILGQAKSSLEEIHMRGEKEAVVIKLDIKESDLDE
jgi:hypothetical protein